MTGRRNVPSRLGRVAALVVATFVCFVVAPARGEEDADPTALSACGGDPCTTPPGECYEAQGACNPNTDQCDYSPKPGGAACTDDGIICTVDVCDGQGQCTHAAGNAGTVCRAAQGECDLAESCDGESSACPPDAKKEAGTACSSDGIVCTLDVCDGSRSDCTHPAGNAGSICRAASGSCDQAEACDGVHPSCPVDIYAEPGVICRPAAGACDVAESCTGATPHCPADSFAGTDVTCRPAAGACDAAETCTGATPDCPTDLKNTGVCRAAQGECDLAESCDGESNACPPDEKKEAGTACASDGIVCTLDVCDGSRSDCTHPAGNATTICRAASGNCDQAEACDGVHPSCPVDVYAEAGETCRPAAGPCDVAESCTGTTAVCPADGFEGTDVICRAAAGPCDVAESCTGATPDCPTDLKSGTGICRAAQGECDLAESCDGESNACPPDEKKEAGTACASDGIVCTLDVCDGSRSDCTHPAGNAGTICRAASGNCDQAEACDGVHPSCPVDVVVNAGVICRPAQGECDLAETCNGTASFCPADEYQTAGTGCDDGNACTSGDTCDAFGICAGTFACPEPTVCQASVACDPAAGCVVVDKEEGAPCTAGDDSGTCDGSGSCIINLAPVANAGPDQTITYTTSVPLVQLDGCSSSDDGLPAPGTLTFSWKQIGGNSTTALSDSSLCNPTFTAPDLVASSSEVLSFQLTVSDGYRSDSDTVDITVTNANRAPYCEAAGPPTVGEQTSGVQLVGSDSFDPDNDTLTYRWEVSGPQTIILSDATAADPTFDAPELGGASGGDTSVYEDYLFTLTVSDGALMTSCEAVVRVENANHAPVASVATPLVATAGDTVTLDATESSDPDNDLLTYRWIQSSGSPVILQGTDTATPSFVAPIVEAGGATLTFEVTVTDVFGASDAAVVSVQVSNAGDPPDCSSATLSTSTIWPPNHKLVTVQVVNVGTGSTATTVQVAAVLQDEPVNGIGDGDTSPDAIVLDNSVLLRAERSGAADGRVYRIDFSATSSAGSCSGTVWACVPHSKKDGGTCGDDGALFDSTVAAEAGLD